MYNLTDLAQVAIKNATIVASKQIEKCQRLVFIVTNERGY